MLRLLFAVLIAFSPVVALLAEPSPTITLRINPQVLEPDHRVSWEEPLARTTPPGNPVVVKIHTESLRIRITITPFVREQDIMLVVQGDVTQRDEEGERRSSTLQSLSVPPGESIVFFPLGRGASREGRQMLVTIRADLSHD